MVRSDKDNQHTEIDSHHINPSPVTCVLLLPARAGDNDNEGSGDSKEASQDNPLDRTTGSLMRRGLEAPDPGKELGVSQCDQDHGMDSKGHIVKANSGFRRRWVSGSILAANCRRVQETTG